MTITELDQPIAEVNSWIIDHTPKKEENTLSESENKIEGVANGST